MLGRVGGVALLALAAGCPEFEAPFGCRSAADCDPGERCEASLCRAGAPEDAGSCAPKSCAELDRCGLALDDGCGHDIDCPCAPCEGFREDFEGALDPSEWELNGVAEHVSEGDEARIRLTNAGRPDEWGGVFRRSAYDSAVFTLRAVVRVVNGLADGVALGWFDPVSVEQNLSPRHGGLLGYVGNVGYAVELDTWGNDYADGPDVPDGPTGVHLALVRVTGEPWIPDGPPTQLQRIAPHLETKLLGSLSDGAHTLTVVVDRGSVRVWLDGELGIDTIIPGYAAGPAWFGATAANGGATAEQELLELELESCALDPRRFVGGYRARRELTRLPDPGATVRVPIPADAARRADGRDVAVFEGHHELPAQWEDRAQPTTLIVKLPGRASRGPIFLYYDDPHASPRLTDGVFVLSERFDAPLPSTWVNGWRAEPCDGRHSAGSVCVGDEGAPPRRLTTPIAVLPGVSPFFQDISVALDLQLAGGFGAGGPLLALSTGTSTNSTPTPIAPEAYTEAMPDARLRVGAREVHGFTGEPGSDWRRIHARFALARVTGAIHLEVLTASTSTPSPGLLRVDDLTLRVIVPEDAAIVPDAEERRSP